MSRVRLIDVTKRYGDVAAVDHVNADIAQGEFVTLLGPSGCGKTTTLRMVAGLIEPSDGTILFDERVVNNLPAHRRNIGFVFQSHALFPHLSVADNIAYGLSVKGRPKAEIKARVEHMLEMVNLKGYGGRMPSQLSGGQQQRVALARVLATDPTVLLFDEPLSALDRNLRDTLKYSILELQRRTRKTAIYVTHDQSEAFAISDRIFVMNHGRVEQSGTQLDIYLHPQSEFVAHFVGDNNALRGTVVGLAEDKHVFVETMGLRLRAYDPLGLSAGEPVIAFVRPENIDILNDNDAEGRDQTQTDGTDGTDITDVLEGKVEQITFEGPTVRFTIDANGTMLRVVASGLERLKILGTRNQKLRLRLGSVSLIRDSKRT